MTNSTRQWRVLNIFHSSLLFVYVYSFLYLERRDLIGYFEVISFPQVHWLIKCPMDVAVKVFDLHKRILRRYSKVWKNSNLAHVDELFPVQCLDVHTALSLLIGTGNLEGTGSIPLELQLVPA